MILCMLSTLSHAVSLFNESDYRPLIADKKAYLLGDLLTVLVLESSDAQSTSDLASKKETRMELESSYNGNKYEADFGFNGKGNTVAKTGRNGKIKATLTVRINSILANQSYQIEGQQQIQVNGEQQTILLSGIVRQEDISPQNTILSTRIANAQITYTGNGSVSNSQNHNMIYKVLSFLGLV